MYHVQNLFYIFDSLSHLDCFFFGLEGAPRGALGHCPVKKQIMVLLSLNQMG